VIVVKDTKSVDAVLAAVIVVVNVIAANMLVLEDISPPMKSSSMN